ncbi:MAG TPA: hypothetical protein VGD63_08370 [Steroidobacteraceae bacterium]
MGVRLTWGVFAPYFAAGLLVGCGGGGGGYGGGGSGSVPAPTVSFTAPMQASSISLGQAVTLTWQSAYATSCAASASASAGAFTSTAASGTVTVAPTATGSASYMLNCMGSGGTATATVTVTVNPNIVSTLSVAKIVTIGPALDPAKSQFNGNPYGLVIAPTTAGLITKGDLIVCNFNAAVMSAQTASVQGTGTTIVGLHPAAGSMPYPIADDPKLEGCNALAIFPDDSIAAAAWAPSLNPLVTATGLVNDPFGSAGAGDKFVGPWGEAYAPGGTAGVENPALYVSEFDGSIDRIDLNVDAQSKYTKIATGFCVSGSPGAIFAPSGLTYDPSIDTLYVVDTSSNSVVAFAKASTITSAGVVVNGQCPAGTPTPPTPALTFSGPMAASARVIAQGGPLIAPISAALLSNGDLIVANGDLNITAAQMPNLAVEVSPVVPGGFVGQPIQLDAGTTTPQAPACGATGAGATPSCGQAALFGIVATVDAQGNPLIYFNDDNANAVMLITK